MDQTLTQSLLDFIRRSPSVFHATKNFTAMLRAAGFIPLHEQDTWNTVKPGGSYYVVRNDSSLIALRIPASGGDSFLMAAAHSDSPSFKIKEHSERLAAGHYVQLSTEKYGGMLMSTWFDRPLSAAGRVLVRQDGNLITRLVDIDRDLLVIPSVAIHMDRSANEGKKFLANIDTLPLLGSADAKGSFLPLIAQAADAAPEDILGSDLFLYCRQSGTVIGADEDYIVAPKLDDLECAYGCMTGFLSAAPSAAIQVCCIFDNEEVGSSTKQGAASAFLRDTLRRISLALGKNEDAYQAVLARSFLVSADNAHAQHPNHPEYADSENCPYMNEGIVIKYNANQRYATDAVSSAVFKAVCAEAGVPVQTYANRSDLAGGSTLGSIADTLVPVSTVDIGLPQLAMHSAVETAGVKDLDYLARAMAVYFGSRLRSDAPGVYSM